MEDEPDYESSDHESNDEETEEVSEPDQMEKYYEFNNKDLRQLFEDRKRKIGHKMKRLEKDHLTASRYWGLTVYEDQWESTKAMINHFTKTDRKLTRATWADEICPTTGKPHMQLVLCYIQPTKLEDVLVHFPNVNIGMHIVGADSYYRYALNYIVPDELFWDPDYDRAAKKSISTAQFHNVGQAICKKKLPIYARQKAPPKTDGGYVEEEAKKCKTVAEAMNIPGNWKMNKNLREAVVEIVLKSHRERKAHIHMKKSKKIAKKLYPWQCALVRYLMDKGRDDRYYYVVSDPTGGHGKSVLSRILEMKGFQIIHNTPNECDMARYIKTDNEQGLWIVDAERDNGAKLQWGFIERLKNGIVTKTKYDGQEEHVYPDTLVVIFTNLEPHAVQFHLSRDRLRLITIHGLVKEKSSITILEQDMDPEKDKAIVPDYRGITHNNISWPEPTDYSSEEDDDNVSEYDYSDLAPPTKIVTREEQQHEFLDA